MSLCCIAKISLQQQYRRMRFENVSRPRVPILRPNNDRLIFQVLELDHYVGPVYPGMPGPRSGSIPIMRIFGITTSGNSICCHVHGFSPYFYVNLPGSFTTEDVEPFKSKLNDAILSNVHIADKRVEAVLMVEIKKEESLVEHTGDDVSFAKITLAHPNFVPVAKNLLTTTTVYQPLKNHSFSFFEYNVDIETRFMVDTNILGCCWIKLPPGKWFPRSEKSYFSLTTSCQIEVDVSWKDFIAHTPKNQWASIAEFTMLSFDIECTVRGDIFPVPHIDPVIQIANVVKLHGEGYVITRNIFTLKSCAPIGYAEIFSFETEEEMLEAWAEFVRQVDPDIFTGYNIIDFDLRYLIERAKHLKLKYFNFLGRLLNVRSEVKERKIGHNICRAINFEGRVQYDMLPVIRRHFKLESYTLNNVSRAILGDQKEDVHFSNITALQNGDEHTRKRLAVYCLKDAELPLLLLMEVDSFTKDVERARAMGVPISSFLTKGKENEVARNLHILYNNIK